MRHLWKSIGLLIILNISATAFGESISYESSMTSAPVQASPAPSSFQASDVIAAKKHGFKLGMCVERTVASKDASSKTSPKLEYQAALKNCIAQLR